MKEKILNIIKMYWLEEIYFIITICYLYKLNKLNHVLLSEHFKSNLELLMYNDNIAVLYFFGAFILFSCGCFIGYRRFKKIWKIIDDGGNMIVSCLSIMFIFILLCLIIYFINNPILRAIMGLGFIVFLIVSAK